MYLFKVKNLLGVRCLEGAKRKLSGPVQLKEALSLDVVVKIYDQYNSSPSLAELRFLVILLLEYNNRVYVRGHKYVLGPTQTHFSPSHYHFGGH